MLDLSFLLAVAYVIGWSGALILSAVCFAYGTSLGPPRDGGHRETVGATM